VLRHKRSSVRVSSENHIGLKTLNSITRATGLVTEFKPKIFENNSAAIWSKHVAYVKIYELFFKFL